MHVKMLKDWRRNPAGSVVNVLPEVGDRLIRDLYAVRVEDPIEEQASEDRPKARRGTKASETKAG